MMKIKVIWEKGRDDRPIAYLKRKVILPVRDWFPQIGDEWEVELIDKGRFYVALPVKKCEEIYYTETITGNGLMVTKNIVSGRNTERKVLDRKIIKENEKTWKFIFLDNENVEKEYILEEPEEDQKVFHFVSYFPLEYRIHFQTRLNLIKEKNKQFLINLFSTIKSNIDRIKKEIPKEQDFIPKPIYEEREVEEWRDRVPEGEVEVLNSVAIMGSGWNVIKHYKTALFLIKYKKKVLVNQEEIEKGKEAWKRAIMEWFNSLDEKLQKDLYMFSEIVRDIHILGKIALIDKNLDEILSIIEEQYAPIDVVLFRKSYEELKDLTDAQKEKAIKVLLEELKLLS